VPGRGRSLIRAAGRIPVALAILLLAAVGLRLAFSLAYQPAVMTNADSISYMAMASGELFSDPARPAGYSMFLSIPHAISSSLELTIAVQHLLGIATGLFLYATARRIGAPIWAATVAAAGVLLPLDQIALEHTPVSETLFTLCVAIVLYCSVRALDPPGGIAGAVTTRHAWIVAAGVMLGLAAWVRALAVPLALFLGLWFFVSLPGRGWVRIGRAALAGGTAAAVVLVYFSLNSAATGHFGLTRTTGWTLYARTAPFADCSRFDPPAGTEALCEDTPPRTRPSPDFYHWVASSPAWMLFGPPPTGDEKLREFGAEALTHQPFEYLGAVFDDTLRYFLPAHNARSFSPGYDFIDIDSRNPTVERDVHTWIRSYYPDEPQTSRSDAVATLSEIQDWLRAQPPLLGLAAILGLVGCAFAAGRVRAGLALLVGAGLLLLIVPSAILEYNVRFVVPASGPLVGAGGVGLWVIVGRLQERRRRVA
jgi:hypothetical protein